MTTLTTANLTDSLIADLRIEAEKHGDDKMVAICWLALRGEFDGDEYTGLRYSNADRREVESMSQDDAREAIVDVINEAMARA